MTEDRERERQRFRVISMERGGRIERERVTEIKIEIVTKRETHRRSFERHG